MMTPHRFFFGLIIFVIAMAIGLSIWSSTQHAPLWNDSYGLRPVDEPLNEVYSKGDWRLKEQASKRRRY